MGVESGRRSVVVGLAFLVLGLGVMTWTYVGRRTSRHIDSAAEHDRGEALQERDVPDVTPDSAGSNKDQEVKPEAAGVVLASGRSSATRDNIPASPVAYAQSGAARLAVPPDANPDVASVVEAAKTKGLEYRRSIFLAAPPFDLAAFRADPDGYCRVIEPGRVWQAAKPDKDVPALEVVGDSTVRVPARGTVELAVQAVADSCVAFSSMDLGAFENRLTSITVRTDAKGVARVRFTATEGTTGAVNILAACPLTTGQVNFHVEVLE